MKPKARQWQRTVFKVTQNRDSDGKRIKVPIGKETVRSASCPQNGCENKSPSTKFEGVNEGGWVFLCANGHRFIADPA